MSAKTSLLLLFLFVVTLGVLRCDRTAALTGKEVVQLSFWNGFTGPDGRVMLEMIRQFNRENPDVQVTMQRIAWATYYNKLMVSALDGRGPEVYVLQAAQLPRMDRAGLLADLTDVYDETLRADISPRMVARMNFGTPDRERLLGLPLDAYPHGMYVNVDMLRAVGSVNPDGTVHPPENREEFFKVAEAAMKLPDVDGAKIWGWGFGDWSYNFFTLVPQFGGQYVDADGVPTLDHPGNVAALQFLVDLHQKYKIAPPPQGGIGGWVGFRQKRVAMAFDGVYMLGDLKRLNDEQPDPQRKLNYIGVPIPQIGPKKGTYADSHALCVRSGLSDAETAAAKRFIRFLSDQSLAWAGAGQVPARKSVRESETFKSMQVQYAFSQQMDDILFPPRTPSYNQLAINIALAVESAIRGPTSAADALKKANEDYKRYLERDRMEQALYGHSDHVDATRSHGRGGAK